uniref:Immunoglobulin V-set domain-containing protein n=1 Tax=Myripristis murdjan TaxID=586833 RepID=A0A667X9H1_9TELE
MLAMSFFSSVLLIFMSFLVKLLSWIFFFHVFLKKSKDFKSDKASRLSVSSNCSLRVRDLRAGDAGSYLCDQHGDGGTQINVYLSLLSISSPSRVTDLTPGGNLVLSCFLFSYYNAGMCKGYSNVNVTLTLSDALSAPCRYELIQGSSCNVTLAVRLQQEDNNRKWRCQMHSSTENHVMTLLDFRSTFVFQSPVSDPTVSPSSPEPPAAQLPISRIVLCAALPVMIVIVAVFTWRTDRKRGREFAKAIEFQEIK